MFVSLILCSKFIKENPKRKIKQEQKFCTVQSMLFSLTVKVPCSEFMFLEIVPREKKNIDLPYTKSGITGTECRSGREDPKEERSGRARGRREIALGQHSEKMRVFELSKVVELRRITHGTRLVVGHFEELARPEITYESLSTAVMM